MSAGRDVIVEVGARAHAGRVGSGWAGLAAVLDAEGKLPKVCEVDAYRLGAAPTRFGSTRHGPGHDPYVPRTADDVDSRLAAALGHSAMVVLTGWSMVGKTRTLFEAVRRELPEARVLFPERTVLHAIPDTAAYVDCDDTIVVWLDDLDEYLDADQKLTSTWLAQMRAVRRGRTVVVATMRREAFRRLEAARGELTKDVRILLDQAEQIPVESTSDHPIEHTAAAHSYPDLNLDLYREHGYGLGEVLAGAPALLARYRRADPRLRAVIEVAIDWRRVGRADPIPEEVLVELASHRARMLRPSLGLDRGVIAETVRAAREPVEATARIAPLQTIWSSDTDCGYRVFDYLVAADDTHHDGRQRPIPETFWDAATHGADARILGMIGATAQRRGHLDHAIRITRRAAHAGHPVAMFNFGILLQEQSDIDGARIWWRRAADSGHANAMFNLGALAADRGDLGGAEAWWRRAAAAGNINALFNLGGLFQEIGDVGEAEICYRAAADAGQPSAMFNLGGLLRDRGDFVGMQTWYRRAADAGHPGAMYNLGVECEERGDRAGAEAWWIRAADAGLASAMYNLGVFAEDRRDLGGAVIWWSRAADAGNTNAMFSLGSLFQEFGDLGNAEAWWHRAANAGHADAEFNLGLLYEELDDI
ncbi:hypothetical protein ACFXPR_20975 [Nocardia tengchongensis]|uniref:tetratricopeptide repeat protein n=1 Tax=Nocardia tengchongensis TaxID=2055889 RepID=UPI00368F8C28